MTTEPASDVDGSTFLVERYLPSSAADGLPAAVARVALLCAEQSQNSPAGAGVQYLQSAYLPAEDTCFCLFQGPSADAIREVNDRGEFALDRITDAVLMLPGSRPAVPYQAAATRRGRT